MGEKHFTPTALSNSLSSPDSNPLTGLLLKQYGRDFLIGLGTVVSHRGDSEMRRTWRYIIVPPAGIVRSQRLSDRYRDGHRRWAESLSAHHHHELLPAVFPAIPENTGQASEDARVADPSGSFRRMCSGSARALAKAR